MTRVYDHGRCEEAGKMRYPTRALAKRAGKQRYPSDHLAPYRCGDHWHVGHLPQIVAVGRMSRDEVYGR